MHQVSMQDDNNKEEVGRVIQADLRRLLLVVLLAQALSWCVLCSITLFVLAVPFGYRRQVVDVLLGALESRTS
eukprot:4296880-Ditylum_brightwellii.AAC.1